MELFYPVKNPINQTNLFGQNPDQYKPLGQNGHPGLDFEAPSGTPLYAPCDGDAFYTSDKYGGDGIWIRVPNNSSPQFNVILWHLWPKGNAQYPFKIATDGSITKVKAGDLLGYTDNSGAPIESTGPHLHVGVMPCDSTGEALYHTNGFLGCVDPMPYFNGKYAEDISKEVQIVETVSEVVQTVQQVSTQNLTPADRNFLLDILTKVGTILKNLFIQ